MQAGSAVSVAGWSGGRRRGGGRRSSRASRRGVAAAGAPHRPGGPRRGGAASIAGCDAHPVFGREDARGVSGWIRMIHWSLPGCLAISRPGGQRSLPFSSLECLLQEGIPASGGRSEPHHRTINQLRASYEFVGLISTWKLQTLNCLHK